MSINPEVSVVIPVYNEEEYIEQCVKSINEQQVNFSFEIVICNDSSTDQTEDILEEKEQEIDRLRVITNDQNKGLIGSCNRLLTEAEGRYFIKLDGDSVMKRGSLGEIHSKLKEGYPLVFGRVDVKNTSYLHPAAAQVGKLKGRSTWYGGACIAGHCKQFVDSGGFDQQMIGAEDQELKQRARTLGWSVSYLDEAGVESNFPTQVKPVLYRKYKSAKSHLRQYKNTQVEFSLWELRGPIFWSAFISLLLCSPLLPFSGIISMLLFCVPLSQYARDAKLAVDISGRWSFYVLYPLYEVAGGLARTVGVWSELNVAVKITLNRYITTIR